MKKLIFLIFTLVIPASVFIFLKYFGTNTFEVPCLFEHGIPECSNSKSPHVVSGISIIEESSQSLTTFHESKYLVYAVLDGNDIEQLRKSIIQLIRIQDAFFEIEPPYFALLVKGNATDTLDVELLCANMGVQKKNTGYFYPNEEILNDFLKCQIGLIQDDNPSNITNFALVDTKRNIRGLYQGLDRQEIDKLILELKILKQHN